MSLNGVSITGDRQLIRTFSRLPERVARGSIRKAVNYGATPLVKEARARVPVDSGLSQFAIDKRIVTYKDNQSVIAVVGVKRDVDGLVDGKKRWPQKYQHLVHDGFVTRSGAFVPGTKYLKRAYNIGMPAAQARMQSKLASEIMKEAAKQ